MEQPRATNGTATAAQPIPGQGRRQAPEPWRDPDAVPFVRIQGVTKRFGATTAVDNVSVSIFRGELFALLGGSGSGKSTLLRMLAGFETADSGKILIDGQDVAQVPPWQRPVNMMFQSYALFPHMSVADNVAYGLRRAGMPRAEIQARLDEALGMVRMREFGKRMPHQLSGGQRQRVALARCLVKRPKLLLLDEPLGALDKSLRQATQFELMTLQEETGITFVMVTHDQEEAMTMASRLAVMTDGWIAQVGTPGEVYEYPSSRFVAGFLGDVNILEGNLRRRPDGHPLVATQGLRAPLVLDRDVDLPDGARLWVAVRPEKMSIAKVDPDAPQPKTNHARGLVRDIAYFGDYSMYVVEVPGGPQVRVGAPNRTRLAELPITWDDEVDVTWPSFANVPLRD